MQIDNDIFDDFNNQIDKLKQELSVKTPPENCSVETINGFYSIIARHLNRLEVARQIFNEYANSGIVKIPD